MDRSKGYNRAARKFLHIAGGGFAFTVPFVPYWLGLLGALSAVGVAYWLRPKHAWWLRYISKPIDRKRNVITGLRGYATVILLLVLLWPVLEAFGFADAKRYVMFGWLALAFGDGLAGLVGPGPTIARTVPWNRHKTWWGLIGCFAGVLAAHLISFGVPFPHLMPLPFPVHIETALIIAIIIALLESLDLKLDDNYTVGLGAPFLACGIHLLLT